MPTYVQQLNSHLAKYKTRCLGELRPGTFVYRGEVLQYHHILPEEHKWLNILEPFRTDIQQYLNERPAIKLHRYFHHLNSSQAFALNVFFPYFERGASSQLLAALGSTGLLSSWVPEYIADAVEGTNVDMTWQSGGTRTYCEVKLSEQEFGSARNDDAHLAKLKRIYRSSLTGACAPELLQPEKFFQHYQLLRNVWLVARESGSQLVFFVPRSNTKVWCQLAAFLRLLKPPLAARVRAVAIEDALSSLISSTRLPSSLNGYAKMLHEKYVPPAAA